MRAQRPAGGWPWEQPGYTFSTGWPYLYKPVAADQIIGSRPIGAVTSASASLLKDRMAAEGKGWGTGTLAPLSDASDPSKGGYMRGPLRKPGESQPNESCTEREQAKRLGVKRFRTGEPCTAGHVAERYTCDAKCVECVRLRHRAASSKGPGK